MIASGDDDARSLQLPTVRARRRDMLEKKNVAPLASLVEQARANLPLPDYVPTFDPCDGGVAAELLLLLETPGREAVKSGFVSRNNPDDTAEILLKAMEKAAISRTRTIIWNAVPWFLGSSTKGRSPSAAEVRQAVPHLSELLRLLQRCRSVLALGGAAQGALQRVSPGHGLAVFTFPHPGPRLMRTKPEKFDELVCLLGEIRGLLEHGF